MVRLMAWFEGQPPPPVAFALHPGQQVIDPARFFESLRDGPEGVRARSRALRDDLLRLWDLYGRGSTCEALDGPPEGGSDPEAASRLEASEGTG